MTRGVLTGETECQTCGTRVLVARYGDRAVVLDAVRNDGPWEPRSDNRGILFADYTPTNSPQRTKRDGHQAHTLRCEARLLGTLERSRERILQRTTEPVEGGYSMLPVLSAAGVALMVRGSTQLLPA